MSKVFVLIPAHNNKKEVLELLGCLERQTYKSKEIVLVDDGSTDNTEHEVRKSYPDTTIIRGNGNLWWTGANVLGVDYILQVAGEDDFILLLNNDLVVENDYIETLVNASMANGRAITGSATVDYNDPDFMEGGIQLDHQLNLTVNRDNTLIEHTEIDTNVDVLPGRGTLAPVEVFKKIGSFNRKKLPHYGADYEFTLRAKRAGYKLIICHKAKVFAKLDISGIDIPDKKFISLMECYNLLFSRKSRTNLLYYTNYVWLCSEKAYRVRNLLGNVRGILMVTVGKTYPVKIVMTPVIFILRSLKRMIFFVYIFMFKGYPLRGSDIENQNLSPQTLVDRNILIEREFRGQIFYYIDCDKIQTRHGLSAVELAGISHLKNRSFNYRHKIDIIFDKINLLVSVKQTDEI